MKNEEFARSLVSVESYDLMIANYKRRPLAPAHRRWLRTLVRQRALKCTEASS